MTPSKHVVASGITSAGFAFITQSLPGAVACFLSGIFIDLDHLLDFYLIKRKMCWSLRELHDFCLNIKTGKIYLVFHSYELMAVLWISAYFYPNSIWIGCLFGMSVHLLLDQVSNPIYPWAYFLLYRMQLGFPKKIFFHEDFIQELKNQRAAKP